MGNLDSTSERMVMSLLRRLRAGGATICLVTHDSRLIHLPDRKMKMLDGKVMGGDKYGTV